MHRLSCIVQSEHQLEFYVQFFLQVDGGSNRRMNVQEAAATGGFFISVFNLMNAILGSGILGLSYAMAQLGAVLFL